MPRRLTLRQRLADPAGTPTRTARLALVALACLLFVAGCLAWSGSDQTRARAGRAVTAQQLVGHVGPAPKPAGLRLSRVSPIPTLRRRPHRRYAHKRPAAVTRVRAPTPQPEATAQPVAATATPAPTTAPPVAAPPVVAPAPPPARPAPPRQPPPAVGERFDSSG